MASSFIAYLSFEGVDRDVSLVVVRGGFEEVLLARLGLAEAEFVQEGRVGVLECIMTNTNSTTNNALQRKSKYKLNKLNRE